MRWAFLCRCSSNERRAANGVKQLVEILLVENNSRDVQLTRRAFEKMRIMNPLRVVRDGAEALDFVFATGKYAYRAEIHSPQLILLDLTLPKKSGIEVLQQIKVNERTRDIPVIVITASNRDRDISACRHLGVERYIVKPVGFQSFSKLTPCLRFGWALVKPNHADLDSREAYDRADVLRQRCVTYRL